MRTTSVIEHCRNCSDFLRRKELWKNPHLSRVATALLEDLFFHSASRINSDLLIEVGAHNAETSKRWIAAGRSAIAVEANPRVAKRVLAALGKKQQGWYVNAAVGGHCGNALLRIPEGGIHASEVTTASLHLPSVSKHLASTSVLQHTLDCIAGLSPCATAVSAPVHAAKRIALWIDVEGGVGDVLGCADEVLKRTSVVYVECENQIFWKGQWDERRVTKALEDRGFVRAAGDAPSFGQRNLVFFREDVISEVEELLRLWSLEVARVMQRASTWPNRSARAVWPLRSRVQAGNRARRLRRMLFAGVGWGGSAVDLTRKREGTHGLG